MRSSRMVYQMGCKKRTMWTANKIGKRTHNHQLHLDMDTIQHTRREVVCLCLCPPHRSADATTVG